jgi:hypothetical protein
MDIQILNHPNSIYKPYNVTLYIQKFVSENARFGGECPQTPLYYKRHHIKVFVTNNHPYVP